MSNQLIDPKAMNMDIGVTASPQNVEIPKFYLMQGLSEQVSEGKASVGEIRDSSDNKLFATTDEGMQAIPVCVFEYWQQFEIVDGQKNFITEVRVSKENEHWLYETVDKVTGTKLKNDRVFKVYLLPLQDMSLPRLMTFGRSARKAGSKIVTQMMIKNPSKGLTPWSTILSINPKMESKTLANGKSIKFASVDVEPVGEATQEQVQIAYQWKEKIMGNQQIKKADNDAIDGVEF